MEMLYILEIEQFSSDEGWVCLDLKLAPPHRKLLYDPAARRLKERQPPNPAKARSSR
jgi:hypothetical protein